MRWIIKPGCLPRYVPGGIRDSGKRGRREAVAGVSDSGREGGVREWEEAKQ